MLQFCIFYFIKNQFGHFYVQEIILVDKTKKSQFYQYFLFFLQKLLISSLLNLTRKKSVFEIQKKTLCNLLSDEGEIELRKVFIPPKKTNIPRDITFINRRYRVEKRISKVAELVRIKPDEMINWDNLYSMTMDWELEESPRSDLSLRALKVSQRVKIETMHDLVNFPSIELIKVRMCGLKTIRELKNYIKKAIQVIGYVRIPSLKGREYLKVVNNELFSEFTEKTKKDIREWLGD